MNLPVLAASIVHVIRNSMEDSAINQADTVQHMIEEAMTRDKEKSVPRFTARNYYVGFNPPPEIQELRSKAEEATRRAIHENSLRIPL